VRRKREVRAIDCPCGHRFETGDDEQLFGLSRAHVDRDHPEMPRTDEQIRERIDVDAYDAVTACCSRPHPPSSGLPSMSCSSKRVAH
jgi:hypothetical protein